LNLCDNDGDDGLGEYINLQKNTEVRPEREGGREKRRREGREGGGREGGREGGTEVVLSGLIRGTRGTMVHIYGMPFTRRTAL
jgi:hypothetical protein